MKIVVFKYVEDDMGQKEQMEDKDFENFEEHKKYKSLASRKEILANIFGIISIIFYIIGFILLYVSDVEKLSYIIACWGIAFITSIIGYKIKKTKITEMMLLGMLWLLVMGILVGGGIFVFIYLLTGRAFMWM